MFFRVCRSLSILLLAGLVLPIGVRASGPTAITATFNGVPAAWLQDSNPPPTASNPGSDLTQPNTPRYGLVLAAKEALANDIAFATPVTTQQVSDLAVALGVQLSAPPDANPMDELNAVIQALTAYAESRVPPMVSASALAKRAARRASAGGGCDSNNCWVNTPVETSEPTSDPAGSHPTYLYGYPNYGFFASLCGPGSSTETMGNWTPDTVLNWSSKHGSGPQAYLLGMADNEMSQTGSNNQFGQPIYQTLFATEVDTLNDFIGGPYYVMVNSPTDSQWWSEINNDEGSVGHVPEVFAALTSYLADWQADPGQNHFIMTTTVGENGNGNIKYYDTATSYSSGGSTLGFHDVTRGSIDGYSGGLIVSIW